VLKEKLTWQNLASLKSEIYGSEYQNVGNDVVPSRALVKDKEYEDGENGKSDALLHDLQLRDSKLRRANPIRRHLERIFQERDTPTRQDRRNKWAILMFQMAVPGDGHEDVGYDE
jgi:hypothetical protein